MAECKGSPLLHCGISRWCQWWDEQGLQTVFPLKLCACVRAHSFQRLCTRINLLRTDTLTWAVAQMLVISKKVRTHQNFCAHRLQKIRRNICCNPKPEMSLMRRCTIIFKITWSFFDFSAAALYYLAELIEEYTSIARKVLRIMLIVSYFLLNENKLRKTYFPVFNSCSLCCGLFT